MDLKPSLADDEESNTSGLSLVDDEEPNTDEETGKQQLTSLRSKKTRRALVSKSTSISTPRASKGDWRSLKANGVNTIGKTDVMENVDSNRDCSRTIRASEVYTTKEVATEKKDSKEDWRSLKASDMNSITEEDVADNTDANED